MTARHSVFFANFAAEKGLADPHANSILVLHKHIYNCLITTKMERHSNKWLLATAILSISLLTVMAGAAIAPALDVIQAHFADLNPIWVQMLVSVPALFIIITSFIFPLLCQRFTTRAMVLGSLTLYIVSGTVAFLLSNIWLIMVMRALLGLSVGIMMPLSTGLLFHYFSQHHHARLMGISSAMNYLGAVIATLITGLLSHIEWNYSFLVYLLGFIALIPCYCFLPASRLESRGDSPVTIQSICKYSYFTIGMFLAMGTFFIYPTNYAILCAADGYQVPAPLITVLMALMDLMAMLIGMFFANIAQVFKEQTRFIAPLTFLCGYFILSAYPTMLMSIAGSLLVGIGSGIGIPVVFAGAGHAAGKDAATIAMPLMSATLYLAQFTMPLIVSGASVLIPDGLRKPYVVAFMMSILMLVHALCKRHDSNREDFK